MKTCPRCKETKEDTAFYRNPTTGGLHAYCYPCKRAWERERRQAHKEQYNARQRKWRKENWDKAKASQYKWRKANPEAWKANYNRWASNNRIEWEAERRKKLRESVFAAYGGYVCSCCCEDEPMFMTIDHIANDGNEHRRKLKSLIGNGGTAFFDWLKRNKFPSGYQVLCRNCNWGKHVNGGVCPHRESRRSND